MWFNVHIKLVTIAALMSWMKKMHIYIYDIYIYIYFLSHLIPVQLITASDDDMRREKVAVEKLQEYNRVW